MTRCPASPASAIPAGPPMAHRPRSTPTRIARGLSRSCTTASSRTTSALRAELAEAGLTPQTETDTETVALLTQHAMTQGAGPIEAAMQTLDRLEGAFALAFLFDGEDDLLDCRAQGFAAGDRTWRRRDVRGFGRHRAGADDRPDHLSRGRRPRRRHPRKVPRSATTAGLPVHRETRRIHMDAARVDKAGYKHFMAKEIAEQPAVLAGALRALSHAGRHRPARAGPRFHQGRPAGHGRLRHRALCLPHREILVRAAGRPARRGRYRLGIPLPRTARAARHRSRFSSASRARRRTRSPPCAIAATRPTASCRSSMSRPRPSRGKATSPCRSMPEPRSASPLPRPSPAS